MQARTFAAAVGVVVLAFTVAMVGLSRAHAENAEMWANVTNGKFATALAATGDGIDSWTPPRPGEPCVVQVDVTGTLTWCLQVKAAPDAAYAIVATGTGDQNIVTTAWPYMNLTVSSYTSGSVSAWGAQGTR